VRTASIVFIVVLLVSVARSLYQIHEQLDRLHMLMVMLVNK
jgi:hypothetical protein